MLGSEFLARLERFAAQVRARRARDDSGTRRALGRGVEFDGHRPYRPGEDLRDLDWELLARVERPFVRVRRAEHGERWAVLLDTSASMGLGRPGKLQLAAEIALAAAYGALPSGVTSELLVHAPDGGVQLRPLRSRVDLAGWLELVRGLEARGRRPMVELLAHPRVARARRVVVIGDLLDLAPRDVLSLARPGVRLAAVRVLAPHELAPGASEGVEWVDPEAGERLESVLDPATLEAYGRALEATLEAWRTSFARHGQSCRTWSSASAFEDAAMELCL